MKIAISIGHGKSKNGGYDSGAVGGNYHEFKLCKEVGKYLDNILDDYECTSTLINYNGDMYLYDRIKYIKDRKYDLALELHMNAFNHKAHGSECYYKWKSSFGKKFAGDIAKSIAHKFGALNRGAKIKTYSDNGKERDYFGFVREIPGDSFLIETLFIDNDKDRENLITGSGQRACAQAIADVIIKTYNLKPKCSKPDVPDVPNKTAFKKGDKVQIVGNKYATGENIPLWVKRKTHTLKADPELMANKKYRALLKEINSYVYVDDLVKVESGIKVGDMVVIKPGAIYGGLSSTRGLKVPTEQLSPKKHTVTKIDTHSGVKEALLGDISSWVAISYLS